IAAREDRAGPRQQRTEQREFPRGEGACAVPAARFACFGIEADDTIAQDRLTAAALPAEDGAHARQELADLERFDEVVVGAEIEADYAVIDLIARRDDDDGNLLARAEAPQDRQSFKL